LKEKRTLKEGRKEGRVDGGGSILARIERKKDIKGRKEGK
jgi:hypothetical protein